MYVVEMLERTQSDQYIKVQFQYLYIRVLFLVYDRHINGKYSYFCSNSTHYPTIVCSVNVTYNQSLHCHLHSYM